VPSFSKGKITNEHKIKSNKSLEEKRQRRKTLLELGQKSRGDKYQGWSSLKGGGEKTRPEFNIISSMTRLGGGGGGGREVSIWGSPFFVS